MPAARTSPLISNRNSLRDEQLNTRVCDLGRKRGSEERGHVSTNDYAEKLYRWGVGPIRREGFQPFAPYNPKNSSGIVGLEWSQTFQPFYGGAAALCHFEKQGVFQRNRQTADSRLQEDWVHASYALAITAHAGRPAPGLYGVTPHYDAPPWRGDRHNNYPEYSSLFWGAFTANHEEQALNYTEFIEGYLPMARRIAREIFEVEEGSAFPVAYIDGTDIYWFGATWSRALFLTALHAQNCWWHYQYFGDKRFLAERAYPILCECATFYVELLKKNEPGDYTLWPTEKAARFRDLRAKGAFRVSASCAQGHVQRICVVSEQGNPLRIESPWPHARVVNDRGREVRAEISGREMRFSTIAGEHYELQPGHVQPSVDRGHI